MEFFHYWNQKQVDGSSSVVVGAVKVNQQVYRVERMTGSNGVGLNLMPVMARVYHPLDREIQRALLDLWMADRATKKNQQ